MQIYILKVDRDAVSFVGPFKDGDLAFQYGLQKLADALRWTVVHVGEPFDYGMFMTEPVNVPFFGFFVEAPV